MNASSITRQVSVAVILFFTVIACDQPTTSTSEPTNDTSSVKKMSTENNSEMPVHTPTDSAKKMPNPYDTIKK